MKESKSPRTPYVGLVPYCEEDAPYFFGREQMIGIITANLRSSRLTLLYGASGVGKSSVLHAGVVYSLRQIAERDLEEYGAPEFAVVVFDSWRDDPIAALATSVQKAVSDALKIQSIEPIPPSRDLSHILKVWTERGGVELLIILDQFEEYFQYRPLEDGDGTFAVEFPRALNRRDLRVKFLLSLREDALSKLDRFKGKVSYLFDKRLQIKRLDLQAARSAIENPILEYNHREKETYSIEPNLVKEVLNQVEANVAIQAGNGSAAAVAMKPTECIEAPYLQLIMTRIWEKEREQDSRVLRLSTLRSLKGLRNIVQTHVNEAMDALEPKQQEIAVRSLDYLVTPSGAKIAYISSDIAKRTKFKVEAINSVLDRLSNKFRILRRVEPPPDQPDESRYEIFHDMLVPAILDWTSGYAQKQERIARERRTLRRDRLFVGAVAVTGIVIILALVAFIMWGNAKRARDEAQSALAETEKQKKAVQDTLNIVYELDRAVPYFKAIMRGHTKAVNGAAYSPDGDLVVTASDDQTARLWKAETGESIRELVGHTGPVNSAVFSPDGDLVVTASDDQTARLWKAETGESIRELVGHNKAVKNALFSKDGNLVVTVSDDNTARVWDVEEGKCIAILFHKSVVNSAAFSPDGKLIVTASDDLMAQSLGHRHRGEHNCS